MMKKIQNKKLEQKKYNLLQPSYDQSQNTSSVASIQLQAVESVNTYELSLSANTNLLGILKWPNQNEEQSSKILEGSNNFDQSKQITQSERHKKIPTKQIFSILSQRLRKHQRIQSDQQNKKTYQKYRLMINIMVKISKCKLKEIFNIFLLQKQYNHQYNQILFSTISKLFNVKTIFYKMELLNKLKKIQIKFRKTNEKNIKQKLVKVESNKVKMFYKIIDQFKQIQLKTVFYHIRDKNYIQKLYKNLSVKGLVMVKRITNKSKFQNFKRFKLKIKSIYRQKKLILQSFILSLKEIHNTTIKNAWNKIEKSSTKRINLNQTPNKKEKTDQSSVVLKKDISLSLSRNKIASKQQDYENLILKIEQIKRSNKVKQQLMLKQLEEHQILLQDTTHRLQHQKLQNQQLKEEIQKMNNRTSQLNNIIEQSSQDDILCPSTNLLPLLSEIYAEVNSMNNQQINLNIEYLITSYKLGDAKKNTGVVSYITLAHNIYLKQQISNYELIKSSEQIIKQQELHYENMSLLKIVNQFIKQRYLWCNVELYVSNLLTDDLK